MNRRFFLQSLGYLSLGSLLSSCQGSAQNQLNVQILRRSLPVQLLKNAKQALSPKIPVNVSVQPTMAELYSQLQLWNQRQESLQDNLGIVGLGDYWLTQAIRGQLIEPLALPPDTLKKLPDRWRSLVQRNDQGLLDPQGKIWAAPYRWGATVLIYRKDKLKDFDWDLSDWSDLWRPELHQRVGLLNQPREVIGMTLKSLGYSYNEADLSKVMELESKLRSLHQQTRHYASEDYIQPLILGDVWVAMGWSVDALPALRQDDKLAVVFPKSGSALWADVWVQAKAGAEKSALPSQTLFNQWVNYWWSPEVTQDISKFSQASSVLPQSNTSQPSESERLLTADNLSRSESLLPLDRDQIKQYQGAWLTMRRQAIV